MKAATIKSMSNIQSEYLFYGGKNKNFSILLTMIVLFFLNAVGFSIGGAIAKKIINNKIIVNAIAGACALISTISILINGDFDVENVNRAPEIINIIIVVLFTILFVRDAKLKTDIEKDKQNKTITENDILRSIAIFLNRFA